MLQELLISAKDEQFEAFIPCSERIVRAVTDMVILFPEENNVEEGNSNSSTRCTPLTFQITVNTVSDNMTLLGIGHTVETGCKVQSDISS